MDCREAQRRLNNISSLAEADSELRAHATTCPACCRAWEAASLLELALETSREDRTSEQVPDFRETRRAVEERLQARGWSGWQGALDFWKFGTSGARWSVSAGAFAAALAFLTLVPFRYQKTVGYEVALAGVSPELARHEDRLQALLAAMGAGQANVDWIKCDSVCEVRISDLPDLKQCKLLVGALEQLCEVQVLESGARQCVASKGPILEMAVDRVKSAGASGVSESEARELLQACFGGDFSLCASMSCDSTRAATCSTLCKTVTGPCCAVMDSACVMVCPAPGTACGTKSSDVPCVPGSCMAPPSRGIEPGAAAEREAEVSVRPDGFALAQNQPNPFNPSTEIAFTLAAPGDVRLEIFNSLGRRVRTLVEGQRAAGAHTITWDGRDENGRTVPSGTYLYRLSAGHETLSRTDRKSVV